MTPAAGPVPGGMPPPAPPSYGAASLADLSASVLAALGVPGEPNALGLPETPRACVLLIDGLGWELLTAAAREDAPFLATLLPAARPLTAGFPATTATSLTSVGTGRPPGGHGMFGYQVAVPGTGRLLNCLRWDDAVDPYDWQPGSTVFERAEHAGVPATHLAPRAFAKTGLTRAGQRGGRYPGADSLGEVAALAVQALRATPRAFVFAYHADLDATGHRVGCGSQAWRLHLGHVDRLVQQIAERLPAGAVLYVTADHGMVDVTDRVDVDELPALLDGVTLLGGEPRARHVYTRPGAAADVAAAWRAELTGRAWVLTRDEAIAAGWFGPVVDGLSARIGDVLAVPYGATALVARDREPKESRLVGMHGSLDPADLLVPLLTVRP